MEPLIKLLIGPHKEEVLFLVDTGAEKSTIQKLPKGAEKGKSYMSVIGAKGEPFKVPVLKDVEVETRKFALTIYFCSLKRSTIY